MIANGPSGWLLGDHAGYDRLCLRSLLAFFSNRVLKGGPRLLLHLALCLVGIILLTRLLPERVSNVTFGSSYSDLVRWKPGGKENGHPPASEQELGGGLRMVVFGENGIAIPARSENGGGSESAKGWTEMLCKELNCTRYLSLIPTLKSPHRSLVSNAVFAAAVEEAIQDSQSAHPPGPDYSFLHDQYPVSSDIPDLASQVSTFLSMPAPERPPRETLWVFNLGFWDVWSLAALPREVSFLFVDRLVQQAFVNVERLYQASLDEKSIAHSDYYGRTTPVPRLDPNSTYRSTGDPTIEPFRIVIPHIFDPSLTPAWARARPAAIKPHTKVEQQRNAASLTERWNQGLTNALESWVKTEAQKVTDEQMPSHNGAMNSKPPPNLAFGRRDVTEGNKKDEEPRPALPPPLRDAVLYDMPHYIIPLIIERQFRDLGLEDATGVGANETAAEFVEVLAPCVEVSYNNTSNGPSLDVSVKEIDNPNAGISDDDATGGEHQQFKRTPNFRATLESMSFHPTTGRLGRRNGGTCDDPENYLFHDAFTLSQRAIENIAQQSADMVRWNISIRAFWSSIGKPAQRRAAGPWIG